MAGLDAQDKDGDLVVSWDDSPAIQLEYLPPPPTATGVAVRPERLTDQRDAIYYPSNAEWYEHMHRRLTRLAAVALGRHRVGRVVSSMTLGWDTALAEAARELELPLIVALPYKGLQSDWQDYHRQRFSRLVDKAAEVITLTTGGYQPWKVKQALEHRVRTSDLVLALWDQEDEVTKEGIALAYGCGKTVVNLWGSWVRYGKMITGAPGREQ